MRAQLAMRRKAQACWNTAPLCRGTGTASSREPAQPPCLSADPLGAEAKNKADPNDPANV